MNYATVVRVIVPAWSTLGYGEAIDQDGNVVYFVGDARPMTSLGHAVGADAEPMVDLDEVNVIAAALWNSIAAIDQERIGQ